MAKSADLREIIDRLLAEFGDAYSADDIGATVQACRDQLDIAATEALAELTERLARQRLAHPHTDHS